MDLKEKSNLKILDIGSGSGNITLSLAKNLNSSFVTGIDVSEKAIEVATQNKILNDIPNAEFKLLDVMNDDLSILEKFDVLVSNPPYISSDEFNYLEPELKVYEPRIHVFCPYLWIKGDKHMDGSTEKIKGSQQSVLQESPTGNWRE